MSSFNSEALDAGRRTSNDAAAEVRAEMARQGKSKVGLAQALGVTLNTAKARYEGTQPYDLIQLTQVSIWLGVPLDCFLSAKDAA